MAAIVLWAAALSGGTSERGATTLDATAGDVETWLRSDAVAAVVGAAARLADRRTIAVVGAGYGVPIACEIALKIKEASYVQRGGFRGRRIPARSSACSMRPSAIVGIVDDASRAIVERPLATAVDAEHSATRSHARCRARRARATSPTLQHLGMARHRTVPSRWRWAARATSTPTHRAACTNSYDQNLSGGQPRANGERGCVKKIVAAPLMCANR